MKIDGIEYFATLMIGDMNSDQVEEHYFSEFAEMNEFIRANKENSAYQGCELNYSLIENVGGKPGDILWTRPIRLEEFSEDDIQTEMEGQRQWLIDASNFCEHIEKQQKTLCFMKSDANNEQKQSRLQDFAYVCPRCFREIDDCRCRSYPYYLVQIDRMILPAVRELNVKGYRTTGCCAGHPEAEPEAFRSSGVSISFDRDYDFDEPLPEGATYSKIKHSVSFIPSGNETANLEDFQRKSIWKLDDWVEYLSDLNEEDEGD